MEGHLHWVTSVCYSPDGKTALSGSYRQDCDHVGPREWCEVKGMYVLVVTYTSRLWKGIVVRSPLCATLPDGEDCFKWFS